MLGHERRREPAHRRPKPTPRNWTKEPPCSTYLRMDDRPDQIAAQPDDAGERMKLQPSAFMRELRPEYYSDTAARTDYELDRGMLEYHLDTITNRNQTHEFEIFCRKLCQRVICPNLRPQTGPEGGGDSKADSETYPVAGEVSHLTYVGEPNAGSERWAFAFSAKKKWAEKVRGDVESLVRTNRIYDRIICVTSQFARAKQRAAIEDSLREQYGIPVTVHDRSWIVAEVIEHDRKDLAFNYLHVGREVRTTHRLGPTDYSRSKQLEDIEKALSDPSAFDGMETQRVTEALLAAKLARALELPRTETDGRFARAVRLADQDGTHRQRLETRYESIWTGYWWYDDVAQVNASYDQFEAMLHDDDHVKNVEFLANLAQLLVNSVRHGHLSVDDSKLLDRVGRLKARLETIRTAKDHPNASLEAETALVLVDMNMAVVFGKKESLSELWPRLSDILERAKALGEFEAERLVALIEIAGNVAGLDPAYAALIEDLAAFVSERRSDAEGARILVKRAEQLGFGQHFEIIRLLGKATRQLSKKEFADELIDALPLLALAYRSAGLLWAARAACLMAIATIVIESEDESEVRPDVLPLMEIWAWISLQLRHVPDYLSSMQFLATGLSNLPLTDESKKILKTKYQKLDLAFASNILNFSNDDVRELETLPDMLERLGLAHSRSALLYTLGHEDCLWEDGTIPADETKEGAAVLFSALASQPVSKDIRGPLILNRRHDQPFETRVLGLTLTVNTTGSICSVLVAEAVLGGMEALLATAINLQVLPHTESFSLDIIESDGTLEPQLRLELDKMRATLVWPTGKIPADFDFQRTAFRSLMEVTGTLLAATHYSPDMPNLLKQLYENELVADRMTMVAVASNSYSRALGRRVSRLPEGGKAYPLRARPTLNVKPLARDEPQLNDDEFDGSHRAMGVRSVVDVHLWDRARWRGAAYFDYGPQAPPVLALMFEDRDAAEKIFIRWRERFGAVDKDEAIHLAIIRGTSETNPAHYKILVTSSLPGHEVKGMRLTAFIGRHTSMMPATSENLDRFLAMQAKAAAYLLIPAIFSGSEAEPLIDLHILKRRLVVRNAADVGPNDIEAMALSGGVETSPPAAR